MTTPDQVAALVKRLREEASFSGTLLDNSLKTLVREAADALESLSPPAGMVMVPRDLLILWHTVMLQSTGEYEEKCAAEMGDVLSARERKE